MVETLWSAMSQMRGRMGGDMLRRTVLYTVYLTFLIIGGRFLAYCIGMVHLFSQYERRWVLL